MQKMAQWLTDKLVDIIDFVDNSEVKITLKN
jgi:hypothetical protein